MTSLMAANGPTPYGMAAPEDPHVLLVAEDELSNLAEHYRMKLTLDGYRVTTLPADRLTAQEIREVNPDFVIVEIHRLTQRTAAIWAKLRWARGAKRTPI